MRIPPGSPMLSWYSGCAAFSKKAEICSNQIESTKFSEEIYLSLEVNMLNWIQESLWLFELLGVSVVLGSVLGMAWWAWEFVKGRKENRIIGEKALFTLKSDGTITISSDKEITLTTEEIDIR